jgi:hypothetical protein
MNSLFVPFLTQVSKSLLSPAVYPHIKYDFVIIRGKATCEGGK